MALITPLIFEDGSARFRTESDTITVGYKSYGDPRAYEYITARSSSNATLNGTYNIGAPYNGVNTFSNGSYIIFYTGKLWAFNATTTNNYWDCMYTCPSQIGTYMQTNGTDTICMYGSFEDVDGHGDVSGTLISSNGHITLRTVTTDILTVNQARIFFEPEINSNKIDIIDGGAIALAVSVDELDALAIPSGNRDEYGIQMFQTVLIGTSCTVVADTSFDASFIGTGDLADLGCTEWIYTSNFRTEGIHYTDNLVDDTDLKIAGIEHNTHLGVQVNTPDTRPHWGENGEAAFSRDTRRLSIRYNPSTPNYPEFPDWRELGNMYDEYMDAMDRYRSYYRANRVETLNVQTVNLTTNIGGGATYQVSAKLRLSDGSCFFPSLGGNASLWVEADGTPNTVTGNALNIYDPCLCQFDDKIYLPPNTSNAVKTQETANWNPVTANTVPSANWSSTAFLSSVIADDGTVHFPPKPNENEVVKYDPTTNTISMYGSCNTTGNTAVSFYTALNHRGILYSIPSSHFEGQLKIRAIDPATASIEDINLMASTEVGYINSGISYGDNIYFMVESSSVYTWYSFNTTNNAFTNVNTLAYTGIGLGFSPVIGPDACIYSSRNSKLVRLDLTTNTAEEIGTLPHSSYSILAFDTGGYLNVVSFAYNGIISSYARIKIFDVPIDPNFLCNRYLNTT